MNIHSQNFRDLAAAEFDTTTLLAHAAEQAIERRYEDFCIVDVDCHHYETEAFKEIIQYMDDPVLRHEAKYQGMARPGIASADGSYQETRRPHHPLSRPPHREGAADAASRHHADAALDGRAWASTSPACSRRRCSISRPAPRVEVEVALAQAYNRWLCEKILGEESRFKSMLYLPFNDPEACYKTVQEFGDKKGVIGFMVTATHYTRRLRQRLHARPRRRSRSAACRSPSTPRYQLGRPGLSITNRFIAVHALGFTWHNMLHLTNWIVNGMPERFPKLKTIWIEFGLAWIPFLMQRLDNEYMMRTSEAPLLKQQAVRLHARHVLHDAADGDGGQPQGARTAPSR